MAARFIASFRPALAGFSLVLLVALAGCIERKERITIHEDGSVDFHVRHDTDSFDEMYLGDAVPSLRMGWIVTESTKTQEDGDEVFVLEAEATFPPDVPLPGTYAEDRGEPIVSLKFPTTLTIEPRDDGLYYHFRRTYEPRPWAFLDVPRKRVQEQIRELEGADFDHLTVEQGRVLIAAVVRIEVLKLAAFARQAFDDTTPHAPQDGWLAVRAAIVRTGEEVDATRLAETFVQASLEEDDDVLARTLEREQERFQQQAKEAIEAALKNGAQYTHSQVNEFTRHFERHRRYFEITEELADDRFEITVELPGTLAGHNADNVAGSTVTWTFDGTMLRDREVELMATSRVAY